ncbi:UPF0047 domain containing protein [Nitzschia inconspicua]|uniref:UPF0047 domain containing protein n=1 Tax=Nitzschia inconspicua TaxID=303405 RepID=A0A9K3KEK3_9STRA|nr:UPF0047 domain containing protein [Nitzschia inconspicua]
MISFSPFWLVVSFLVVPLVSSLATAPNGKTTTKATITTQPISLGLPVCVYHQVDIPTTAEGPPRQAVSVEDLTPTLLELLANSNMQHGTITVISRHTTTAITINERESRLAQDMADYFLKLAPPDERSESEVAQRGIRYKHNMISIIDPPRKPNINVAWTMGGMSPSRTCCKHGEIRNPSMLILIC